MRTRCTDTPPRVPMAGPGSFDDELRAAEQALVGLQALDRATALASAGARPLIAAGASQSTAPHSPPGTLPAGGSLRGFDAGRELAGDELAQELVSLKETHAKIMAQNIALLADVEAMTEQITRLRNEKAVMASRLQSMRA